MAVTSGRGLSLIAAGVVALIVGAGYYFWQSNQEPEMLPLTINTDEVRDGDFPWLVDETQSAINVRVTHEGGFVEGAIADWTAQLNIDPDNIETAFIDINLDMQSIVVGDLTDEVRSSSFLNTKAHSSARFLSDFIWQRGDGDFDAEGLLEIAGEQRPFTIKISMQVADDKMQIAGYTGINRLEWGIGETAYPDESTFGLPFELALTIIADKQW